MQNDVSFDVTSAWAFVCLVFLSNKHFPSTHHLLSSGNTDRKESFYLQA